MGKGFGFKGLISKILSFKGLSFKGLSFNGPSFKGLSLKGVRLRFRCIGFKNLLLYLNTSLYKIEHEFCPIKDLSEIVTTRKNISRHFGMYYKLFTSMFRNDKIHKSVIEKSCYVVALNIKNMYHT